MSDINHYNFTFFRIKKLFNDYKICKILYFYHRKCRHFVAHFIGNIDALNYRNIIMNFVQTGIHVIFSQKKKIECT